MAANRWGNSIEQEEARALRIKIEETIQNSKLFSQHFDEYCIASDTKFDYSVSKELCDQLFELLKI